MCDAIFGQKLENIEYVDRPSVYGLLYKSGSIGVVKVKNKNGYFLPGGGKEDGETDIECLKRECIEEIGWKIEIGESVGSILHYSYCIPLKCYLNVIGSYYFINLLEKVDGKIEDDHELIWQDPEYAIEHMILEHQAWAIKKSLDMAL